MPTVTVTPNAGFQIPAFDQPDWQVQFNYDWTRLDNIFGGTIVIPALNVTTLTAGNAGDFALPPSIGEVPSGAVPGSTYTLSHTPSPVTMLAFYVNGVFQRPVLDYTLTGNVVTLDVPTISGAKVYAQYFYAAS